MREPKILSFFHALILARIRSFIRFAASVLSAFVPLSPNLISKVCFHSSVGQSRLHFALQTTSWTVRPVLRTVSLSQLQPPVLQPQVLTRGVSCSQAAIPARSIDTYERFTPACTRAWPATYPSHGRQSREGAALMLCVSKQARVHGLKLWYSGHDLDASPRKFRADEGPSCVATNFLVFLQLLETNTKHCEILNFHELP